MQKGEYDMKMKVTYNDRGFSRKLGKVRDEIDEMIEDEIAVASRDTSHRAKDYAAVVDDKLAASIRSEEHGPTAGVIADSEYAPYVEFGTGSGVNVPGELQEYAMQFKGAGIRNVNNFARPYLVPAFFINRDKLDKRIDKRVRNIFRRL